MADITANLYLALLPVHLMCPGPFFHWVALNCCLCPCFLQPESFHYSKLSMARPHLLSSSVVLHLSLGFSLLMSQPRVVLPTSNCRFFHPPSLSNRALWETGKFVSIPQSDKGCKVRNPNTNFALHRRILKDSSILKEMPLCIWFLHFHFYIYSTNIYWVLIKFQGLLYRWFLLMGIHYHHSNAGVVNFWSTGHVQSLASFFPAQREWSRNKIMTGL